MWIPCYIPEGVRRRGAVWVIALGSTINANLAAVHRLCLCFCFCLCCFWATFDETARNGGQQICITASLPDKWASAAQGEGSVEGVRWAGLQSTGIGSSGRRKAPRSTRAARMHALHSSTAEMMLMLTSTLASTSAPASSSSSSVSTSSPAGNTFAQNNRQQGKRGKRRK